MAEKEENNSPLTTSDSEIVSEEQDYFGYRDYARVLVNLTRDSETPLIVGIFGRWGSGKTSLMKLMQARLKRDKAPRIQTIWLNVWQLNNQDELWNAFLQALVSTVRRELSFYQKLLFNWSLLRDRVRWPELLRQLLVNAYRILIVIIPLLSNLIWPDSFSSETDNWIVNFLDLKTRGTISLVLGLWLILKPVVEATAEKVSLDLGKVLKDAPYEVRVSTLQKLQNHFAYLVNLWVGKNGRLVIFIDDLDRCAPDKMPEVLDALKLFMNTRGCIYVLGLDQGILLQGIAGRYQFDEDEASDYLDKIIQTPFNLPPLQDNHIADFVRKAYPEVVKRCETAPKVFSLGLEPNPRKVKRGLNSFLTLLELAEVRLSMWEIDDLDPELLAKMVVIQSRFPLLHESLAQNPELLVEIEQQANQKKSPESKVDDFLRRVSELSPIDRKGKSPVPAADFPNLLEMLSVGNARFGKTRPGMADLSTYIYLTSTYSTITEVLRPARADREALLSNDTNRVWAKANEAMSRTQDQDQRQRIHDTYFQRLEPLIVNQETNLAEERFSANLALVYFDLLLHQDEEKAYKNGLARIYEDPRLHKRLAELYEMNGRLSEARDEFAIAGWLDPEDPTLREALKDTSRRAGRPLSVLEMAEARLVFGDSLDYSRVRIVENARFLKAVYTLGRTIRRLPSRGAVNVNTAVTIRNTCYFSTELLTKGQSFIDMDYFSMPWLIHELTHVWQHQHEYKYLSKSMLAATWDFGGEKGLAEALEQNRSLQSFNPEQQAEIARTYYNHKRMSQDTAAWEPFIKEFLAPGRQEISDPMGEKEHNL